MPAASHQSKGHHMPKAVKFTLAALAAALMLASAVSTASARTLSITNQSFRVTWRSLEFDGGIVTIRCPVTLEGSFHSRTIAKIEGSLIGYITRAIANQNACTNGRGIPFNGTEPYNGGTASQTLPWHVTYEAFEGTLPNISSIDILLRNTRFGISAGGCVAQYGATTDNITGRAARDVNTREITSLAPVAGRNVATKIREDSDPFNVCPASGRLIGTSTTVTLLGETARLTVTLI
jgi:hypothetical protein